MSRSRLSLRPGQWPTVQIRDDGHKWIIWSYCKSGSDWEALACIERTRRERYSGRIDVKGGGRRIRTYWLVRYPLPRLHRRVHGPRS